MAGIATRGIVATDGPTGSRHIEFGYGQRRDTRSCQKPLAGSSFLYDLPEGTGGMGKIADWTVAANLSVNGHTVATLKVKDKTLDDAIDDLAAVLPSYYASKKRIALILKRLGKVAAAKYLENKLPSSARIRSGDLAEILAARYVEESTEFATSISKLRWKDHRDMAMRGDDLIGLLPVKGPEKIHFLKGEVKSRAALTTAAVSDARKALTAFRQRPSPHALEFIADRLHEDGEDVLADLVDDALLADGIALKQVSHLIFTFSGNDPSSFLAKNLRGYLGKVPQTAVGLRVEGHQGFISRVFKKVAKNAHGK
jgi:hypothetical protein